MRKHLLHSAAAACSLLAGLGCAGALAQEGGATALEEIVITAERRVADVQRTAASVSVRTGDDLASEGRFTLNQILEDVPGVSGSATIGAESPETGITIRGVKSNVGAGNSLPTSATTALYVDGVFGGVGGGYDLERVEVLRGPQGTLYGRSATGGVIATYTRNPDLDSFGGHVSAEAGNFELRHVAGALNVPVIADTLAVRFSANSYEREGYDHPVGGAVKVQDARVKLLYRPTESLSALFGVAYQKNKVRSGGTSYQITGPGRYQVGTPVPLGTNETEFRQYWAQIDWTVGGLTLTYLPALRTFEQDSFVPGTGPGGGIVNQYQRQPDDRFVTHELHLSSDDDERFTWQVGAIYFNNDNRGYDFVGVWEQSGALLNHRIVSREITDLGAFAEGTFSLTDRTRLTAGLRYDETQVRATSILITNFNRLLGSGATRGRPEDIRTYIVTGEGGAANFTNTTYKLRLEHDLGADHLVYGSVSTGFVPGDVQIAATVPPVSYKYSAEELTAYEAGTKNRFLDGRLQINAAAYFYDYAGYQSTVTPNPADPTVTVFLVAPAQMKGAEVEALFQITPNDRIGVDVAVIDPRWVDSPPGFRTTVSQERITGIPPQTLTVSYDRDFDLPGGSSLRLRAEARWFASYDYTSVTAANAALGGRGFVRVGDHTVGNVSLDWTSASGALGVTAYVRNIGDERWISGGLLQTISPPLGSYNLSDPRTYGVVLRANF